MPRGKCTFKQGDVTRALRAVRAAGLDVERVETGKDGKITVFPGKSREPSEPPTGGGEVGQPTA
jgi:hypothetical protein